MQKCIVNLNRLQHAQLHEPRVWVLNMAVLTMFDEVLSYTARWSGKVLEHTLCGVSSGWACIEMSFCFLAWQQVQQHSKQLTSSPFQQFCRIMLSIVMWPDSIEVKPEEIFKNRHLVCVWRCLEFIMLRNSTNTRNTWRFLLQPSLEWSLLAFSWKQGSQNGLFHSIAEYSM